MVKYSYEHFLRAVEDAYSKSCCPPHERETARANMKHPDGRLYVGRGWRSFVTHPLADGTVEATFNHEVNRTASCMCLDLGGVDRSDEYEQDAQEERTPEEPMPHKADGRMTFDEFQEQVSIKLAELQGCSASSKEVSELMVEKGSQGIIKEEYVRYDERLDSGRSLEKSQETEFAVAANFIYQVVTTSIAQELDELKDTMTRDEFDARVEYVLAGYKRTPVGDSALTELINDELSQAMIEIAWEDYSELELPDKTQRECLMEAAELAAGCISSNVLKKHEDTYEKEPYVDDVEFLIDRSKDESWDVRCRVAENPNTPIEILEILSMDKEPAVRSSVARNKNVPLKILEMLSRDKDPYVCWGVAKNPRATAPILDALAERAAREIQIAVSINPQTAPETLDKLASAYDGRVRWNVARNPNTSLETIIRQSDDEFDQVREVVAVNPIAPDDVLVKLLDDEDEKVRLCAKSALRRRAGQMSNAARGR